MQKKKGGGVYDLCPYRDYSHGRDTKVNRRLDACRGQIQRPEMLLVTGMRQGYRYSIV